MDDINKSSAFDRLSSDQQDCEAPVEEVLVDSLKGNPVAATRSVVRYHREDEEWLSRKERFIKSLQSMLSEEKDLESKAAPDVEFIRNYIITRDKIVYHALNSIKNGVRGYDRRKGSAEDSLLIFKERYPDSVHIVSKFENTLKAQTEVADALSSELRDNLDYSPVNLLINIPVLLHELIWTKLLITGYNEGEIYMPKDFWPDPTRQKVSLIFKKIEVRDYDTHDLLCINHSVYREPFNGDHLRLVCSSREEDFTRFGPVLESLQFGLSSKIDSKRVETVRYLKKPKYYDPDHSRPRNEEVADYGMEHFPMKSSRGYSNRTKETKESYTYSKVQSQTEKTEITLIDDTADLLKRYQDACVELGIDPTFEDFKSFVSVERRKE